MNETKANAICKTEGCSNQVIKPAWRPELGRYIYNKLCQQCKHNKRAYGILTPERDALLAEQKGGCGICHKPISFATGTAQVDHCHNTGKVRGILCFRCNTAIGSFDDNLLIIENAGTYLRQYL
jgi:hypothetical protein